MKRASNTFSQAEVAAVLRLFAAVGRGADRDTLQRIATTPAALAIQGKLVRMRERLATGQPLAGAAEAEPRGEAVRPPQNYVSRRVQLMRERRQARSA